MCVLGAYLAKLKIACAASPPGRWSGARRRQAQSEAEAATRLFPFSDLLEFDINGREERAHKLLIAIANKKIILIVLRKVIEARLSCLVLYVYVALFSCCCCCQCFVYILYRGTKKQPPHRETMHLESGCGELLLRRVFINKYRSPCNSPNGVSFGTSSIPSACALKFELLIASSETAYQSDSIFKLKRSLAKNASLN